MSVFLPSEILELIGLYFGSITSFKLILGMEVNRNQVFREGGFGVVLENILFNYPDRYTLTNIKRYLSNKEVPLIKAVLTKKMCVLTMVSDIWNSTYSNFAYVKAVQLGFVDAMNFIGHELPPPDAQLLNMFIINSKSVEAYDKIDFTIEEPLRWVIDKKYLSELNRDDLLNNGQLRSVYEYRGDIENFARIIIEAGEEGIGHGCFVNETHVMKTFQFYYDKNRLEEAIYWLRKLDEELYVDNFFNTVCDFRDLRLIEGVKDIMELTDSELDIHKTFIEKDIKKITQLYLIYPDDVLYIGKEFYLDVLKKCDSIRFFIEEVEREEEEDEEDIKKGKLLSSDDINDWIGDYPCYQLKEVREFVKTHNKKKCINDIKKRIYLFGREDIIWFCNICKDLGYEAVEEDKLSFAYMEEKTIHYPALNLEVKKETYYYYAAAENADDKYHCLFDLAINYLTYFTTSIII
jgi:hypothetical protein